MSDPSAARRLAFLDALRGLAALAVAVQHIYSALPQDGLPPWLSFLSHFGEQGVAVFFVLSGCVIPYAVGTAAVTPAYVARFIARRFIRLDVPYWVCIGAYLLAAKLVGKHTYDAVTLPVLAANLFYVNFIAGLPAVIEVGWTLAIEIQFYVAYLLLLGLSQQVERRWLPGRVGWSRALVFGPPTFVSVLWQLKVIPDPPGADRIFLQPWLFFFIGAAITWALFQNGKRWPIAASIAALFFAGVSTGEIAAVTGAIAGAFIWYVGSTKRLESWGRASALQWLGTVSYSLYLLHPLAGSRPVRMLVTRWPTPWSAGEYATAFALGLTASVVVAWLFCLAVERPSQRFARKIALRS